MRRNLARDGSPSRRAAATRATDRAVERCMKCSGHPVSRTSSMSRSTISSSASAGRPMSPSRLLSAPSFIGPARGQLLVLAVLGEADAEGLGVGRGPCASDAGFCTPTPSSVKSRTPSAAISAIGASASPPATLGDRTRHRDVERASRAPRPARRRRARRCRAPVRCWASPRARCILRGRRPARPTRSVSASSRPGSRRCVWRSTKPGPTQQPSASIIVAPAGAIEGRADLGDPPSRDQDVGDVGRVLADDQSAAKKNRSQCAPLARRRYSGTSTAMRTGTPLVTWRSMTAAGRSATRESISTPRLIGPGCMTIVVGRQAAGRVRSVSPYVVVNSRAWARTSPIRARAGVARVRRRRPSQAPRRNRRPPSPARCVTSSGSSVPGAATRTSAPSVTYASTSLRATRLWRRSPTIRILQPSNELGAGLGAGRAVALGEEPGEW